MDSMYLDYFTNDLSFPFFIQYGNHGADMLEHFHADFHELVIVLNGTATHILNSEESFIKKGDVFVLNTETSHGYRDPDNFKIINIMFSPETLAELVDDLKKSSGYQALFILEPFFRKNHTFSNTLSLPIPTLEYIAELSANIIREYNSKLQGYKTMIYAHFMEIIVLLSREYEMHAKDKMSDFLNLARAVSYMEDNYLNDIKLEKLAEIANLSVRHFSRIFKTTYNTAPIEYIIKLRLSHACFLLKKSKFSISHIACECGFDDSNYFARQFKKHIGITPRKYRSNYHVDML